MNKPTERRQDYIEIAVMQEKINMILVILTEMKEDKKEYRQLVKLNLDEIDERIDSLSAKVTQLETAKAKLIGLSAGISVAGTSVATTLYDKFIKLFL